jgi:ABC-type antimicrobial peptide transport system permease subunit
MTDILMRSALSTAIGFLLGIVLLVWIAPETVEGGALLIFISVAFCFVVGEIFGRIKSRYRKKARKSRSG